MTGLTVCSKSTWTPSIRREHALVRLALDRGIDVVFVEPPLDVRSLKRAHPAHYIGALGGSVRPVADEDPTVITRSAPVPGHRNRLAERIDASLLRRVLDSQADAGAPTVCNLPWQWPAVSKRGRKVFDCADDWTRLFPVARRSRFLELFRQITAEADEVILASSDLVPLFAGRQVKVVPNGADAGGLADTVRPRPDRRCLGYVGTLSERFDVAIVRAVLRALPEWSLDIYGPASYAGMGDLPAPELMDLLDTLGDRVRWHGTIPRAAVPEAIDGADVMIVPIRPDMAEGQSSMKLFDIAARGRPAVVSRGVSVSGGEVPPGTYVSDSPDDWVAGITSSAAEPEELAAARVDWARSNTWEHRWPEWAQSVFGEQPVVGRSQ